MTQTHTVSYTDDHGGTWRQLTTSRSPEDWALYLYAGGDPVGVQMAFEDGRVWDAHLGCFRDEYRPWVHHGEAHLTVLFLN